MEISNVVIMNSFLCLVCVASIKLMLGGEGVTNYITFLSYITTHTIIQLIFISLLVITKGDFNVIKITDNKMVYGISVLNGIFGKWIFNNATKVSKKIDLFSIFIKLVIRIIPGISSDDKDKIINDFEDSKKEKKDN